MFSKVVWEHFNRLAKIKISQKAFGNVLIYNTFPKAFWERYKISFYTIINMNVDDNTKTIGNVILLHKHKAFRSIFQLAITSSTNVFNLKNTFRIISKWVHPDKNGDDASDTLAQFNLLDVFQ